MYLGPRRPSLNKRLAARGSLNRFIRHSLGVKAPRGFGLLTSPERVIKNRIRYRKDRAWAALGWDPSGRMRSSRGRMPGGPMDGTAGAGSTLGCATGCAAGCVSIPIGLLFIAGFPMVAIPLFIVAALVLALTQFVGDAATDTSLSPDDAGSPRRTAALPRGSGPSRAAARDIEEVERLSWRFTAVARERLPVPGLSPPDTQYVVTPLPNEMLLYLGRRPDSEFVEVIAPTGRQGRGDDPGAPEYDLWVYSTRLGAWTTSRKPPAAPVVAAIIADWIAVGQAGER